MDKKVAPALSTGHTHPWYDQDVLSTTDWKPEVVLPVLDLATKYKMSIKNGEDISIRTQKTCLTLFYEPSTRTRLSFEAASQNLGLKILNVADAASDSSSFKGETLEDTGRVISAYASVVVVRHPEVGAAARLASTAQIPVINGGDGAGEHPTQALLDFFTIREVFGNVAGLHIGFCGDLLNGRTVHSLLRLLLTFGCEITSISPAELAIPREVLKLIPGASDHVQVANDLRSVLPKLDVLYMTRVQKERFRDLRLYDTICKQYRLKKSDLADSKKRLQILHPLPRIYELASDIDDDPRAHYFVQAANGVPVRMALLTALLGLENKITEEMRLS